MSMKLKNAAADTIITTMRTTAVDTNTASIMTRITASTMSMNTAAADTTITTMARTTAAMMTIAVDMSTASITKVTRNTTTLPLRNLSASST